MRVGNLGGRTTATAPATCSGPVRDFGLDAPICAAGEVEASATLDDTSRIVPTRRLWTKRALFSLTSVLEREGRFDSGPHGERTMGTRWKDAAGARTGRAAESDTALVVIVDEMQYVPKAELSALCAALHRAAQRRMPILLAAAGLPQLRAQVAEAKTYAERLFEFREVGPLDEKASGDAVAKPIRARNADIAPDALQVIVDETGGYPYFLQEWGKHAWDVAERSPIDARDVARASTEVSASLDSGFFRARFDRLTPARKRYLRAMAELGPGPHRSGEIARALGRKVTALGPTRARLIAKGMIWSAARGDTAFTVPSFDRFMRRVMPGDEWRE